MDVCDTLAKSNLETNNPPDPKTRSNFFKFPIEIREYIYCYVFHSQGCSQHGGCHCGDGLSVSNRQLYRETRPLVYKYAQPSFLDVKSCMRFLQDIRDNVIYIKSLSIIDRELSPQSYMLADVFRHQGIEGLEAFKFVVKPELKISSLSGYIEYDPPIYSLSQELNSPAAVYDMSLRVSRHPLAGMKHLRSMQVCGQPSSEIEEAIFKASMNIEDLARREGKRVKRWERPSHQNMICGWIYSIEIVD